MEASEHIPSENGSGETPWQAQQAADEAVGRPELPVLAALAGGFVLAKLLKAMGPDE
jgi:hypothetical protein